MSPVGTVRSTARAAIDPNKVVEGAAAVDGKTVAEAAEGAAAVATGTGIAEDTEHP